MRLINELSRKNLLLGVEATQVCYVPWVRVDDARSQILEPVSSFSDDLRDDIGSFPWGGELVTLLLLQS